jgi:hypothetical protein
MNQCESHPVIIFVFLIIAHPRFFSRIQCRRPNLKDIDGSVLANVPPVEVPMSFQARLKQNPKDAITYTLLLICSPGARLE